MGNTKQPLNRRVVVRDHPHIHGEYYIKDYMYITHSGSPPYTWGIQPHHWWSNIEAQDHPHIHGEYPKCSMPTSAWWGSPPYTWGIRLTSTVSGNPTGITPIYMRNTGKHEAVLPDGEDHPHIHGEYCSCFFLVLSARGSPPYTWGIHTGTFHKRQLSGITPIYMGNTLKDYQQIRLLLQVYLNFYLVC